MKWPWSRKEPMYSLEEGRVQVLSVLAFFKIMVTSPYLEGMYRPELKGANGQQKRQAKRRGR